VSENKELTELLVVLKEQIQLGGDFVTEQAPALFTDIVTMGRIYNTTSLAIVVPILVVGIMLFWSAYRVSQTHDDVFAYDTHNKVGEVMFKGMFGFILFFPSIVVFAGTLREFTMSWFAPRLYVLEYISDLLN
jgi:hypothetical protein